MRSYLPWLPLLGVIGLLTPGAAFAPGVESITGPAVRSLEGHSGPVQCLGFSPDGRVLASGSWDKTVRLWEPEKGTLLHTLVGHTRLVSALAFSPDGRLLATGSEDANVLLWEVASGKRVATSPDSRQPAESSQ